MLVIDDRERKRLRDLVCEGVPECISKRLLVADYLVFDKCGHVLAIERKEVSDLLGSIPQGKLKRQVVALQEYDSQLLLVQGAWTVTPTGKIKIGMRENAWLASTVQMILWGLQRATGVRFLWTQTEQEMIQTLHAIVKQGQKRCWLERGE